MRKQEGQNMGHLAEAPGGGVVKDAGHRWEERRRSI